MDKKPDAIETLNTPEATQTTPPTPETPTTEQPTTATETDKEVTASSDITDTTDTKDTADTAVTASQLVAKRKVLWVWYGAAALAVILLLGLLLFVLEREGRTNFGIFDGIINAMKDKKPVAYVNGTAISTFDFESTLRQLTATVESQGIDVTDPTIAGDLRTQAVDSLVNTELLRQTALAAGVTVTDEQVNERYAQIETSLGGAETLATRMAELGVTEETLRRDIRNDLLIQDHLKTAVNLASVTVTDEDIKALYDQAVESGMEVPPLDEVRNDIERQIRQQKEQELVQEYVLSLRGGAEVEILI
jgi:hypothetical protein